MKAYLSMLDNPIWNALTNNHQNFSAGTSEIKRYEKDTIPFMGMEGKDGKLLVDIAPFFEVNEEVFLKDDFHGIPDRWEMLNKLNCLQMIYMPATIKTIESEGIIKLSATDTSELFELVNLVQPGFFKQKTSLLGNYYGIKKDGHLVAAAGERFKLKGFTELSAVCTHPEHTGKGYAQRLLSILCNKNLEEGNTPFLHVVDSNTRAIKIYEHLDFKTRINLPLVKLKYLGSKN